MILLVRHFKRLIGCAAVQLSMAISAPAQRETVTLDDSWKFIKQDVPQDSDLSAWEIVSAHLTSNSFNGRGGRKFELSGRVLQEGDNLIRVKEDNTRFEDVLRQSDDFTLFVGIDRPAHLGASEEVSTCYSSPELTRLRLYPRNIEIPTATPAIGCRAIDDRNSQPSFSKPSF